MIAHEHIGVHRNVERHELLAQQMQVGATIGVIDERRAAIHAAVRHVQWYPGYFEAGGARHGGLLGPPDSALDRKSVV